MNHFASRA